jgi:hypothetical protein
LSNGRKSGGRAQTQARNRPDAKGYRTTTGEDGLVFYLTVIVHLIILSHPCAYAGLEDWISKRSGKDESRKE